MIVIDWALLTLKDVGIMLNTTYERQDRPAFPDANRIAAHSDTTIYFGAPNVDEVYEHLHQQDNVERPFITHLGFKSLSIADQDGYNLCFHWPVK